MSGALAATGRRLATLSAARVGADADGPGSRTLRAIAGAALLALAGASAALTRSQARRSAAA